MPFTFDASANLTSKMLQVKNIGAGTLTLRAATSESIEGVANPAGLTVATGWMALAWSTGTGLRAVLIPASTDAASFRTAIGAAAKAGDTFTGNVTINQSAPALFLVPTASGQGAFINSGSGSSLRWQIVLGDATAEGGANAGSDWSLGAFSDAGASIGTAIKITRAKLATAFAGDLTVSKAAAGVYLNKPSSGASGGRVVGQTNGLNRSIANFGNATAESGSNVGSDWSLQAIADDGVTGTIALTVSRATQVVAFSQRPTFEQQHPLG